MSKIYAQLNDEGICIGISMTAGEVSGDKLIEVDTFDADFYLRRVFTDGKWTEAKMDYVNENELLIKRIAELTEIVYTMLGIEPKEAGAE